MTIKKIIQRDKCVDETKEIFRDYMNYKDSVNWKNEYVYLIETIRKSDFINSIIQNYELGYKILMKLNTNNNKDWVIMYKPKEEKNEK